jgi:hypothetical protein
VRQLVLARAADLAGGITPACEVCGTTGHLELHHRQYRSRGGRHVASNLVALCGWGNHTGHHGWAHSEPLAAVWGVSLASGVDPSAERIWSALRGVWLVLDDAGGYALAA